MLQISFILKIFVYLAAFNTFYENNDETFVKLEIGKYAIRNSNAVSHCRIRELAPSPCEVLATSRLCWQVEEEEKLILFGRLHAFFILNTQITSFTSFSSPLYVSGVW